MRNLDVVEIVGTLVEMLYTSPTMQCSYTVRRIRLDEICDDACDGVDRRISVRALEADLFDEVREPICRASNIQGGFFL